MYIYVVYLMSVTEHIYGPTYIRPLILPYLWRVIHDDTSSTEHHFVDTLH